MRDNQNGGTTKKEGQPKMRHNQKGGTIKILTIDMSTLGCPKKHFLFKPPNNWTESHQD